MERLRAVEAMLALTQVIRAAMRLAAMRRLPWEDERVEVLRAAGMELAVKARRAEEQLRLAGRLPMVAVRVGATDICMTLAPNA